ncbi:MAG TPA: carboxypeptidase-like regulatory domain-containing protein [Candidatus Bathyarchaeia archaeon]|nr:carboxypeptidase-like regulatory domain-containing protein [Candidatus Bathyarchaeia archaeon]
MKCAAVIVSCVLFNAATCLAQDRALISGDAVDEQDTPIVGAQVILRHESLRVEKTTTTNADGMYFFAEVVPAEGYVISAAEPGIDFAPPRLKFDVEVGETRHILPSFVGGKSPAPASKLQTGLQQLVSVNSLLNGRHAPTIRSSPSTDVGTLAARRGVQSDWKLGPAAITVTTIDAFETVGSSSAKCLCVPPVDHLSSRYNVELDSSGTRNSAYDFSIHRLP